jgi:DNA-binding response OmpR family regulator
MELRDRPLILFVENSGDPTAAEFLSSHFLVAEATEPKDAVAQAQAQRPDLIIFNTSEPKAKDYVLFAELREQTATKFTPIFVVSGRTDLKNKVGAFEKGADDFIERPYSVEELRARVGARLRGWRLEQKLRIAQLELDLTSMSVAVKSKPVAFSVLEFHLLKFFVLNEGRMVDRQEILASVWPDQSVKSRTIDTHLVSVRKKLRGSGIEIASLYGAGYVLRKKK